jgi:hypothetical protein
MCQEVRGNSCNGHRMSQCNHSHRKSKDLETQDVGLVLSLQSIVEEATTGLQARQQWRGICAECESTAHGGRCRVRRQQR